MEYRVDDRSLSGETFLDFVQQVWPGAYNLEQTRAALSKTMNFTAWDGGQLAGCLRVHSAIPRRRRRSVRTASRSGSHSSGTASANSAGGRSHHRHARSNWTRSSGNRCFSTRTGLPPATV